jgi:Kef-type K+ transport system membrane component KefB
VMGLFVLAFLEAACNARSQSAFGIAPQTGFWLQHNLPAAARHPLILKIVLISLSVTVFFVIAYRAAKKGIDPLIRLFRKIEATEAVTSCVLALVLLYAVSVEWLGSIAGIIGAYLFGYVCAEAKLKTLIERTFAAIGHGVLVPLFFVSIGWTSNFRALGGHWFLLTVIFVVAVVTKVLGCGMAALEMGMGPVRSFRVGCGMISRGEVGLIVTAMAVSTGIFNQLKAAVMVGVVLLTTLVTPLIMRRAFAIPSQQDLEDAFWAEDTGSPFNSAELPMAGIKSQI